eukprot:6543328-Pyramimonas_sp.AAC.1
MPARGVLLRGAERPYLRDDPPRCQAMCKMTPRQRLCDRALTAREPPRQRSSSGAGASSALPTWPTSSSRGATWTSALQACLRERRQAAPLRNNGSRPAHRD